MRGLVSDKQILHGRHANWRHRPPLDLGPLFEMMYSIFQNVNNNVFWAIFTIERRWISYHLTSHPGHRNREHPPRLGKFTPWQNPPVPCVLMPRRIETIRIIERFCKKLLFRNGSVVSKRDSGSKQLSRSERDMVSCPVALLMGTTP
jgi:hypothetical protein